MAVRISNGLGFFRSSGKDLIAYLPGRERTSTLTPTYDTETQVWIQRASSSGGTFMNDSKQIADALIKAIKRTAYDSKIVYLLVTASNVGLPDKSS